MSSRGSPQEANDTAATTTTTTTAKTQSNDNIDKDAMIAEAEAAQAAAEADDAASRSGSVESASAAAAVAATAVLMASAKNKRPVRGKDMPRRPLSAYNLFFRDQREDIKARVANGDMPRDYEADFQAAFLRTRKHKTAEFQAAATTIAARWKALSPNEKAVYEERADHELQVYKERKRQAQHQQEHDNEEDAKLPAAASPASRSGPTPSAAASAVAPSGGIATPAMSWASIRPPMDPRVWGSPTRRTSGLLSGQSEHSQATTLPYDSGRGWVTGYERSGGNREAQLAATSGLGSRRSSQGSGAARIAASPGAFSNEEMLMMALQEQQHQQARLREAESMGRLGLVPEGAGGEYGQQHRQQMLHREEMEQELRYARMRRQALDSLLGENSRMAISGHNTVLMDSLLGGGGATGDVRGVSTAGSRPSHGDLQQHQQQQRLAAAARAGFGNTATGGGGSSALFEQRQMELESIRQSVRHAQLEYDQAAARLEYEKARERAHVALLAMEQERLQSTSGGGGGGEQHHEGQGRY